MAYGRSRRPTPCWGAIAIVVVFAVIEMLGVARWQAWDEDERWQARAHARVADHGRRGVAVQAAGLVVLLFVAALGTALLNAP